MSIKHTPGPWEFETWQYRSPKTGKMDKRVPCVCSSLREMRIAALDSDEGNSPNPYTFTLEEAEANARLIAAAPDLLEMCKQALNPQDHPNFWVDLRAAIARAE